MPAYPPLQVIGTPNREIAAICFDSRKVAANALFVAVKGLQVDGHAYIGQAIEAGAVAVVCEHLPDHRPEGVVFLVVDHAARAMGHYADVFYGRPSHKLKLVGITGTNGKTTNVTLLQGLFRALGYRVGLLSTIENKIDDKVLDAQFTTPDSVSINALLSLMCKEGCTHAFMEVSSHALEQERVAGLHFTGGVFTNITHDHLDYHLTFDNYIRAKKKLFDLLPKSAFALVNRDDRRGMVMLQNCKASHHTFSLQGTGNFNVRLLDNTFDGLLLEIDGREAWFLLTGSFNAYNLLSIYAAAVLLGEEPERVLMELSALRPAKGRFEQLIGANQVRAIVDYSHTPDALKNVLETIQGIKKPFEKVITVVGCGGDRDRAKRPKMAAIAAQLSDKVVITADNPRTEEPQAIIDEMMAGVGITERVKTVAIADRKEAIKTACLLAHPGDIILVAGKGHENYQEIKGVRYPFDDKKVVAEFLGTASAY